MYGTSNTVNLIPDLIPKHPTVLCNVSPLRDKVIYMFQYDLIFNNQYSVTIPCVGGFKHSSTPQETSSPYNNIQCL